MKTVLAVARRSRCARRASRKWFLALGIGITLVLGSLASTLRMDVVDGALAATRLFGKPLHADIRSVDVALRPVFRAGRATSIFYGGLALRHRRLRRLRARACSRPGASSTCSRCPSGAGSCSSARSSACSCLAHQRRALRRGRAHAPVLREDRRLDARARCSAAALLASVTFAAIYGGMLAAAVAARSAALSAATGVALSARASSPATASSSRASSSRASRARSSAP